MTDITKEQYDKLNYREQEKHLKRCWVCGNKCSPFEMIEKGGRKFCSDFCLNEFMWEKD